MKRLLGVAILLLLFVSCKDKLIHFQVGEKLNIKNVDKEVVEQWNDGDARVEIYWLSKEDSIFRKIHYYETGEVVADFSVVHGKTIEGAEYYKNGQKMGDVPYDSNGLLNGSAKYYYEDGTLSSQDFYINDKLHGESIDFDKDGKMTWKGIYENGKLIEQTDFSNALK